MRRVWATLPPKIYEYFFRGVLAGEYRAKQDLTKQFYCALYDECQRRGINAAWNDQNAKIIQGIMANLNFNEPNGSRCPAPAAA
jgi:hypothetical protein